MKRTFLHTNDRTHVTAWLMLMGLLAFLLFSCPVKRALLSSFLPSEMVINLPGEGNSSSVETLAGGHALHCCHGINQTEKTPMMQVVNFPVPPLLPAPLMRVLTLLESPIALNIKRSHTQNPYTHTCLFLKNQSFLI